MRNPFRKRNRCPACGCTDLCEPDGWMPLLYTMSPVVCNGCKAKLEPRLSHRIILWLFFTVVVIFFCARKYLIEHLNIYVLVVLFVLWVGSFIGWGIVGAINTIRKPWYFTIWGGSDLRRSIINYGAMGSMTIYAVVYYVWNWWFAA